MALHFSYQSEPLAGPAPPSLPVGATVRWRPLIPVTIVGPTGHVRDFGRAVLDPGADDTVFPIDSAARIGVVLRPDSGHRVRWRGQLHSLRFGDVQLLLTDSHTTWTWPATVGFSPAQIRYQLLGQAGCLQYMDARFFGSNLCLEIESNNTFPGTLSK